MKLVDQTCSEDSEALESLGRGDLEHSEAERAPGGLVHGVDMQVLLADVKAVDEGAEGAADPVGDVAEARPLGHDSWLRSNRGLLIDGLHLTRVEQEGLLGFAAENEDLCAVQLDAANGLRAHELVVVYLQLDPLLARNHLSVLPTVLVAVEVRVGARVEHRNVKRLARLRLAVRARHHVHPTFIHDCGCRVHGLTRQGCNAEPAIGLRVVALRSLCGACPAREAAQRQYKAVADEGQRSQEPGRFHCFSFVDVHISVNHQRVCKDARGA